MAAKTLTRCRVASIGRFAGGSFGCGGSPAESYEMYRVDCPEMREQVAAAGGSVTAYGPWTHLTEWEAHKAAVTQEYREERRAADRAEAQRVADGRRATGDRIRSALQEVGADVSGGVRWSDNVTEIGRLTPVSAEAVRTMASGSHTEYDVRTVADGRVYRVRLGYGLGGAPRAVPITVS